MTPAGWHCIVTRAQPQADVQVQALRALGLPAQALPLLAIGPAPDPTAVSEAWATLAQRALVMFVSANAVQHFFAAHPHAASGAPVWPVGVRAAAPGRGTALALQAAGVPAEACVAPAPDAAQADSEALWAVLAEDDWRGRDVLVVRGEDGRDWLADTLRAHGAQVQCLAAYRRLPPRLDAAAQALLAQALGEPQRHLWLFGSSEAVTHLCALAPDADRHAAQALASHPRIAAAARAAGFGHVAEVAAEPAAIQAWAQQHPPAAGGTAIRG